MESEVIIDKAEKDFKEKKRKDYNKIIRRPDFDRNYFSLTLDNEPVYTQDYTVKKLGRQNVRFTEFIWENKYTEQQRKNQLNLVKDTDKGRITGERLKALNIEYKGKRPVKQEYLTDNSIRIDDPFETQAKIGIVQKAVDILNDKGIEIPVEPVEFEQDIANKKYYIPIDKEPYDRKSYFYGIAEIIKVHIPDREFNEIDFKIEIIKAVNKFMEDNEYDDRTLWSIILLYNEKGKEGQFPLIPLKSKQDFLSSIKDVNILPDLKSQIQQRGSDCDCTTNDTLIIDSFIIQILKTSRTGGCHKSASWIIERTSKIHKGHDNGQQQVSFGTLIDYYSKDNGCFPKILHTVYKKDVGIKENYKSFWLKYLKNDEELVFYNANKLIKNNSIKSIDATDRLGKVNGLYIIKQEELKGSKLFEEMMDFEQVTMMANFYKYYLIIHDENGDIIYDRNGYEGGGSNPGILKKLIQNSVNTLRIVYYNNHYFHLINYVKPVIKYNEPVEKYNHEQAPFKCLVNYDLETISIEKVCTPYMCQFECEKLGFDDVVIIKRFENPSLNTFDEMLTMLINKCLINGKKNIELTFNGFNGAKFDHHMLLQYLMQSGYSVVKLSGNSGVLNSGILRYYHSDYVVTIHFWDIHQFFSMSLKTLIKKFKLPIEDYKDEANHDEIENSYYTIGLTEYFKTHPIDNYGKNDVIGLKLLTEKFYNECRKNIKPWLDCFDTSKKTINSELWNPYKYATISSMAWSIYTKVTPKYCYECVDWEKLTEKKISQEKGQEFLRNAMFGGRVEGKFGVHTSIRGERMIMLDVVSLYPFVMVSNPYPKGIPLLIYDEIESKKAFDNLGDKLGMFYVKYSQRKIFEKYGSIVLPLRTDDKPLDWTYQGTTQGLLTSVDIQQLLNYGGDVEFMSNGGKMICGIVWESTTETFQTYINFFFNKKAEQDSLDKNDPRKNDALREIYKTYINALSGKPGQRIFKTSSKVYDRNSDEFIKMIENGLNNNYNKVQGIIAGGKDWIVVKQEKSKFKSYPIQLINFTYSYARKYMYDNVYSLTNKFGGSICGDTDSCIISQSHYNYLIDKGLVGNNLGNFKLEWEFEKVYYLQAKAYYGVGYNVVDKKHDSKKRFKGVQMYRDTWQKDGCDEKYPINEEFYIYKLNNNKVRVNTMVMKRKNNIVYKEIMVKMV